MKVDNLNWNTNELNEPEAWLEFNNGRLIEIVNEQYNMSEEKYFYSLKLHCSDSEFAINKFSETLGVIATYCTNTISDTELQEGIDAIINSEKLNPITLGE